MERQIPGGKSGAEADGLLAQARKAKTEADSSIESSYGLSLQMHIEEKHQQIKRIETRLKGLIEKQETNLRQNLAVRGKLRTILKPWKRTARKKEIAGRRALLQRLRKRLDLVREIKVGTIPHGPRIEQLAARKVRFHEPELASGWEAWRSMEQSRKPEPQRRKRVVDEPSRTAGRGRTLRR